ncbi:MAG: hypothetical protein VB108_01125 [Anaerolineaceae bacterium]|nr:hypothetical protein [Anaerolineaceae bacterium]
MIKIDGEFFDIPILSIGLAADMLDKSAYRTPDGVLHRQLIGVYYNFELNFASGYGNTNEYARLWRKLTEPVTFHIVTLWDEQGEYQQSGYFASTRHTLGKLRDGKPYWKELTTSFIAKEPYRCA